MPSLKLSPEHFMINDDSRNFVKEQIERASDGTDETKTKATKTQIWRSEMAISSRCDLRQLFYMSLRLDKL